MLIILKVLGLLSIHFLNLISFFLNKKNIIDFAEPEKKIIFDFKYNGNLFLINLENNKRMYKIKV